MRRKVVSGMMLTLLLIGMLTLAFNIHQVKAIRTIYIRADGSVDPPTAPISSVDNVTYIITDNINSDTDGIVIERSNIILDGNGQTLQGTEAFYSYGIFLSERTNVTIKNIEIKKFWNGIKLNNSSNNSISGNNITNNDDGIWFYKSSNYNSISVNNITNNKFLGVYIHSSKNNSISGNNITDNAGGVSLSSFAEYNIVSGNNITNNKWYGINLIDHSKYNIFSRNDIANNRFEGVSLSYMSDYNIFSANNIANNGNGVALFGGDCSNNAFYHNDFIDNTQQVNITESGCANVWDDGFPSGGNYWSDYEERYPNAIEIDNSGIWNTPYVVDQNNQDNYPLVKTPWSLQPPLPLLRVEPESYNASRVDEIFSVNITINDLDLCCCMSSAQIALKYNNTLLEVLDVVDGPFMREVADAYPPFPWGEGNWTTYYFDVSTYEPDYIVVVLIILHPPIWTRIYPEGNGTLATITFKATTGPQAQCALQLVDTLLYDEWLNGIPHNTVEGYYTILVGDLNFDGRVDILDISVAAQAFGSYPSHSRWNPKADIDNNGVVNIIDLVKIVQNF